MMFYQETELPNIVPEQLLEQVVEFTITIVNPEYGHLLNDPDSPQYHDLTRNLRDQVQVALSLGSLPSLSACSSNSRCKIAEEPADPLGC